MSAQPDLFSIADDAPLPPAQSDQPPEVAPSPSHPPAASGGDFANPTARATDPDTSKQAAESMKGAATEQARRVLAAIVDLHDKGGHGATAHEVVMRLAYDATGAPQQSVVARRCTDLERAGFIADTGDRRPGGSGRNLTVWAPTRSAA